MNSSQLSRRTFLKASAAGAALLASGALAACAAPVAPTSQQAAPAAAVPTVRVLMWSNGPIIDDNFNKRAEMFNSEHEGKVVADFQLLPWDQFWPKIDLAYAAKEPYDAYMWDVQAYAHYKAGLVQNIQPYVDMVPDLQDDTKYPLSLYDVWRFDGENLYALPENLQIMTFFYNKDLFDKAGLAYPSGNTTWDDTAEAATAMTIKNGDTFEQWGIDVGDLHAWWGLQTLAWSMGGSFFDKIVEPTKMQMSDAPNVAAMQFLQDLEWKSNVAPTTEQRATAAPDIGVFQAGKAAMLPAGSWSLSSYKDVGFNWDMAPLPKWKDKRVPAFWFGGWVIPKAGVSPESAFEWARWSAMEYQSTMAANHDWIPVQNAARESDTMYEGMPSGFGETIATLADAQLGDVYHSTSQKLVAEVMLPGLDQLWANKMDAAAAAAVMDEQGNKLLQEGS